MPMNTGELIEERITFDNTDDERDIDVDGEVDSDDDAYSSDCRSSKNSSSNLNTVDKRAHHNALERKRRDHIKDSFLTLRESVPHLSSEKASRAQILKKAAEFIQLMRVKNNSHQNDIHELKRQNNLLESQIRHLERQKLSMVNKCNTDSDEEIEPVNKRKKKPINLH